MRATRYSARGEAQPLLPHLEPPLAAAASRVPHPQERASLLSRLLVLWLEPLLRLGNTRPLRPEDVWPLAAHLRCEAAANLLHRHWIASGSLSFAFLRAFGWRYVPVGLLLAAAYACDLAGPLVLYHVVVLVGRASPDLPQLAQWLALLLATRVLRALLFAFVSAESQVVALQFASALQSIVFQKALRLSAEARARKSTAEVVRLYAFDVQHILRAAYFLHEAWVLPLALAAALALLLAVVSYAALAGFAAAVAVLLLQHALARAQTRAFASLARFTDARFQVVRELFAAVQTVKLHAWERQVAAAIGAARARELRALWRYLLLGAGHIFVLWTAPVVVSTATLAVYALVQREALTAANVFAALALFRAVQEPLRALPRVAAGLAQARISARRVVEFIDLGEVDPYAVAGRDALDFAAKYEPHGVAVAVEGVTCGWGAAAPPLFHALSLSVARGALVVVHGAPGAGKSSLCALLLGEMAKRYGSVYVGGSVAYCSQQPWLQRRSVRENVLFGHAFDPRKYDKVLDACGLAADVAALPAGDRTEVGPGAPLALSSSLTARLALARACYSDADVFVLDAPLATVDADVAREVFAKCVLGLLKHKTRVLVTHDPEVVASKFVDSAIRVGAGGVLTHTRNAERAELADPPVSPLVASGGAGSDRQFGGAFAGARYSRHSGQRCRSGSSGRPLPLPSVLEPCSTETAAAEGAESPLTLVQESNEVEDDRDEAPGTEGRAVLARQGFMIYVRAVGGLRVAGFLVGVQCTWQLLQVLSDLWLAHWTGESAALQQTHARANLLVYVALALGGSLLVLMRSLTVSLAGFRGAQQLFAAMTASLLRAPTAFFDATPAARLLRRYGDDVASVDVRLPFAVGTLLAVAFAIGGALLTAAAVTRYFGLLVVPVLYAYVRVAALYLPPARALQRLQKAAQAPVLAHVTEAVDGAGVVRAFGFAHTHRLIAQNLERIDASNRSVHAGIYAGQWLSLRVQLLGGVLVVGIASALVALHGSLSAGLVGLALYYALAVDQGLEPLVQAWAWLETAMAAPARLQEFIDVSPETGARNIESVGSSGTALLPPAEWPADGRVAFENVSFRYSDGEELVLRDISLKLAPGEKVGVVGPADAGTSSLAMALFRVRELAAGRVLIDGVDAAAVDLTTLRSALAIIPQTPAPVTGSVRGFLDPFDEFTDEHLWLALRRAGLVATVAALDGMLYAALEENGEAFGSAGGRQLLGMARALLSGARVVVLDGAADMDRDTDRRLQQVIRDAFAHATVLTIAHTLCLETVLDADRVLMLGDDGRVADLAAPRTLLARGHGLLYDLAKQGGYLERFAGATAAVETMTTAEEEEEEGDVHRAGE